MAKDRAPKSADDRRSAADRALQSMTGFARAEGASGEFRWAWEVKSVNARNLDVRTRLPAGHDALEPRLRALVTGRLSRGTLSVSLAMRRGDRAPNVRVNREVLDRLIALHEEVRRNVDAPPPRLEHLMSLPGVLETLEEDEAEDARERRNAAMIASFEVALEALVASRREEGARLKALVEEHLDEVAALAADASRLAAEQPEALHGRLRQQLAELLGAEPPLSEDRLVQEVAYLAARADVREEIDRLNAHVEAARELLAGGGAVGRRLDFLCQEFNREANTLCSKSAQLDLTRIGLDLKAAIERLREQVQNIE